ncbi:MAG: ATP-grasp domain-containing protein [Firmicutes bacterium]|nr:ATP-grasp domain-containing protein [Bacillota bacterium]
MKALVTTPASPTSLFVVRRLKELGYRVTVIDSHSRSFVSYSNAVDKRILASSLRYNPQGFAQAVIEELKKGGYSFYFPVLECGFLMSYYRDIIRQHTKMISMSFEEITYAHNKNAMREYAKAAGVRTPHTEAPDSVQDGFKLLEELHSPVVVKLRVACNAHGQKIVTELDSAAWEYAQIVKKYQLEEEPPLIQQYIKGSLISTVNLAVNGEVKGNVAFRALRTVPTSGGTSTYRITVDSPEAELFDARIIKHLNWTGFISFDYMEDEATGQVFLIDCNPRIAPGVILGYYAGVDLIGAFVDLINGKEIERLPRQKIGVRSKLHFLDLGWLLYNLTDKTLSGKEKWACFRTWAKREPTHLDIESIRDIKPWFALWAFLLRNVGRLLSPEGGEVFLEHFLFNEAEFRKEVVHVEALRGGLVSGKELL